MTQALGCNIRSRFVQEKELIVQIWRVRWGKKKRKTHCFSSRSDPGKSTNKFPKQIGRDGRDVAASPFWEAWACHPHRKEQSHPPSGPWRQVCFPGDPTKSEQSYNTTRRSQWRRRHERLLWTSRCDLRVNPGAFSRWEDCEQAPKLAALVGLDWMRSRVRSSKSVGFQLCWMSFMDGVPGGAWLVGCSGNMLCIFCYWSVFHDVCVRGNAFPGVISAGVGCIIVDLIDHGLPKPNTPCIMVRAAISISDLFPHPAVTTHKTKSMDHVHDTVSTTVLYCRQIVIGG